MLKKIIILFFLLTINLFSQTITGKVIYVSDGDTIHLISNNQKYKIRFYGIDTPEKSQEFGLEAKEFTYNKIFGKTVEVDAKDTDRYGRTVGVVHYNNGRDLNFELVKNGYAWWYEQYARNNQQLRMAQDYAKRNRLGLWSHPNPIAPWDYRRGQRSSKTVSKQVESSQKIESVVYVTRTGKKYHRSTCRYAAKATRSMPRSEAEALGYGACGVCKP
ncbi:thermonuclease family protein [uncultured Ilyobacter sp.]|uniref:thermonuclease family protein n=1 Tax=uncultured Ilyobacter sp. TaxID=544433 RepID=UPI002AA7FD1B|nr:thermonuclease family protein [uncultured Ilyobacter sp.]